MEHLVNGKTQQKDQLDIAIEGTAWPTRRAIFGTQSNIQCNMGLLLIHVSCVLASRPRIVGYKTYGMVLEADIRIVIPGICIEENSLNQKPMQDVIWDHLKPGQLGF